MKWLYGILALLAIIFAGFFFFAEAPKDTTIDPDHPWQHKAAEAVEDTQKSEAQADPRKVEDVILQKDYCGAWKFFEGGKNQKQISRFLDLMLEGETGKNIPADDKLILQALFSRDMDYAVKKLRDAKGWQGKMILGMLLSGTIDGHPLNSLPRSKDQLQDALLALDQAEDLNWDNGWIPVYRYLAMKAKDGDGSGLNQFLFDEVSRRKTMESPFDSVNVSFGRLRAENPVVFATSMPLGERGFLGNAGSVMNGDLRFTLAATKDPRLAKAGLPMVEQWHRTRMALVNEGFSDPVLNILDAAGAASMAQTFWQQAHPGEPLPDRYRESSEDLMQRMKDRNPSEVNEYLVHGHREPECGPKWQEAVDNDYALLRDRLQKWDSLQRAGKR